MVTLCISLIHGSALRMWLTGLCKEQGLTGYRCRRDQYFMNVH